MVSRRAVLASFCFALGRAEAAPLLPTRGELDGYLAQLENPFPETNVPASLVPLADTLLAQPSAENYRTLRECLWDGKDGGFFWECSAGKPTKRNKQLYGQGAALAALASFAANAKSKEALGFTLKFFSLLERAAHDGLHGGYVEYFLPDWSTPPVNEPPYLPGGTGLKLRSTHLRMLEALTLLVRPSKDAAVRERLVEMMTVAGSALPQRPQMLSTGAFDRDWTRRQDESLNRVTYGYDLQLIWLLAEAARAAGVPYSPYRELCEGIFANCRKYGFDEETGGFFQSGKAGQAADDFAKPGWAQAEGLIASLELYGLTGDTHYFDCFRKTWAHCQKHRPEARNAEGLASPLVFARLRNHCGARLRALRDKA
jgi:mannose/cellobiose epimerase-like protein (N-acyl-D-glucosamine 2-epimerase family)